MKKKLILLFLVVFILIILTGLIFYISNRNTKEKNEIKIEKISDEEKKLIDVFNEKCEITVFLSNGISDDEIKNVTKKLDKKEYISDIEIVSSEDALEEMKKRFPDKEYIFEGYEGKEKDIFPTSYNLKIKFETVEDVLNDEYIDEIKEDLKDIDNVKNVESNDKAMKSIYENYGIEALKDALENGPDSLQKYELNNNIENSVENIEENE